MPILTQRLLLIALSASSLLLILIALMMEHYLYLEPCPLCILSAVLSTSMFGVAWSSRLVRARSEATVLATSAAVIAVAAAGTAASAAASAPSYGCCGFPNTRGQRHRSLRSTASTTSAGVRPSASVTSVTASHARFRSTSG